MLSYTRQHRKLLTATLSWQRVLLPLLLLGSMLLLSGILLSPSAWTIDIGTPGDTWYSAGFSVPEQGDMGTFRWSLPKSRLLLHGAGATPLTLDLRMHRSLAMLERPYHLLLEQGEHAFAAFNLDNTPGWRIYRVVLPPNAVADARLQALPLSIVSTTYRPGSGDRRDLGVPLDWVRVTPLMGGASSLLPVLLRAVCLTWVVGVLFGWLWRLRAGLWVYLPIVIVVAGLLLWARQSPDTLAWALPSLPWTMGLTTAVLLFTYRRMGSGGQEGGSRGLGTRITSQRAAVWLGGILLLALAVRFYRIDSLPYGLWRDEAEHGLIALRMLEHPTYRPIYVAEGRVNMPALGFYPFALALQVQGIHLWSMRTMTALGGAVTVLPLYALVYRMFGRREIALLAAAFLAVSSWHLTLSRFSFPTIFEPLLGLTGLWLLLLARSRVRSKAQKADAPGIQGIQVPFHLVPWVLCFLAGVCLGTAAQMYHTGRVVPVLGAILAVLLLWQGKQGGEEQQGENSKQRRQRGKEMGSWFVSVALCGTGVVLMLVPLIIYALNEPQAFNSRVNRVSLVSNALDDARPPLAALDEALGRHLLMFHVRGDENGRHHAPGRPLLDVVTGLGFVAGLVVLLRRWSDWRSLFLLMALAISIAPSLMSENGPHAMRSIGAVAFACMIAATGWVTVLDYLIAKLSLLKGGAERVCTACYRRSMIGLVAVVLCLNCWTYFVLMPADPAVWTSFYPIHTQIGAYVRERANAQGSGAVTELYVAQGLTYNAVFSYLGHRLPIGTFRHGSLSPPPAADAFFVLSGYDYEKRLEELAPYLDASSEPVERGPDLPGTGQASFYVFRGR